MFIWACFIKTILDLLICISKNGYNKKKTLQVRKKRGEKWLRTLRTGPQLIGFFIDAFPYWLLKC